MSTCSQVAFVLNRVPTWTWTLFLELKDPLAYEIAGNRLLVRVDPEDLVEDEPHGYYDAVEAAVRKANERARRKPFLEEDIDRASQALLLAKQRVLAESVLEDHVSSQ